MGTKTEIEWTDATWNPIRGCSRVSEGCRHCYAERQAHRFSGPGQPYEGLTQIVNGHPAWTGKVALAENHLLDPLKWRAVRQYDADDGERYADRPRRIFVNSMSDLFHENVPEEWVARIVAVMIRANHHVYQILTKRPKRMCALLSSGAFLDLVKEKLEILAGEEWAFEWPLPNVWLGVSVENQAAADERIPLLLQTPAAVRFISAEPLLGEVDLFAFLKTSLRDESLRALRSPEMPGLDWVIVGGESGPGARPMHPDWPRSLRDQCQAAAVPFFMKQMGSAFGPHKGHDLPANLLIRQFPNTHGENHAA